MLKNNASLRMLARTHHGLHAQQICARHDVTSGAAVHAGSWEKHDASSWNESGMSRVDLHVQQRCTVVAQHSIRSHWMPASCALRPVLNLTNLCRWASIVFVGDSLAYEMFEAMAFAINRTGSSECDLESWDACGSSGHCRARCGAPCSGTDVAYARSDFLCTLGRRLNYTFEREQIDLDSLFSDSNRRLHVTNRSLVVMNTGMWWVWKLRLVAALTVSQLEHQFRLVVGETIRHFVRKAARVVVRLDFPGHRTCNESLQPIQHLDDHGLEAPYHHEHIYTLNHLIAAECARYAACDTLDVSHLSSLRPDVHPRRGAGKNHCVHWCSNGEPLHTWIRLLDVLVQDEL